MRNTRTRLVGTRTGFLAESIVAIVRFARGLQGAAQSAFARAVSVVTPLGWVVLVLAPLALAVGYGVNWLELVVAGYIGALLIVIASIYLIGRNAFELSLLLAHPRVIVGEDAEGVVHVHNPTRRRLLGATVEVPVGEALAEFALPSLRRGASFEHTFAVPTTQRQVLEIGPVRTVRADPIGLVRREIELAETTELFIHPQTIGIPSTTTGFIRDLEGNPTKQLADSDVSFHALREYTTGDERRYIHWKSTAKTGTYMVRQFEETRRSHLVVALSLATNDYAGSREFELAVSVAGSLGVRAIRDAREVSVVVGERTPEFAKRKVFAVNALDTLTRARLLDDLTRVDRAESALAVSDVARVVAERTVGVSVAFLLCGSPVTPAQLRTASAVFPADVEVVAIVCDPKSIPGLRRVPGLHVLTIGSLHDLTKALAKSAAV
ncbi:MAG: DUF58 domain-containing protein [Cryobacterium sp.]|nr:DUF58 domain-containing protein [Cryobacterium sp.]